MNATAHALAGPSGHLCRWCGRAMHEVVRVGDALICVSEPAPGHSVVGYARVRTAAGRDELVRITRDRAGGFRIRLGAGVPRPLLNDTDLGRFPPGALAPLLPLWWVEGGRVVNVVRVAPYGASQGPHRAAAGALELRVHEAAPGLGIAVWSHPQGRELGGRDESGDAALIARAASSARALWLPKGGA